MKRAFQISCASLLLIIEVNAQTFDWAKSFGGSMEDRGACLVVDVSGNIYTTGFFSGTVDFDPGLGTTNLTSVGNKSAFIQKLDPSGNFVWAKKFNDAFVRSTIIDSSGNIYSTGNFHGLSDFDPGAGTTNIPTTGGNDCFIQKLDSSGNLIWVKTFGSIFEDIGYAIAIDDSGNVFTTGTFSETIDFDPGVGTAFLSSTGGKSCFVQKLDSSGNYLWAKSFAGPGCSPKAIAVDPWGNVLITGGFGGTFDFDPGPGSATYSSVGISDVFIQKLDPSGNFLWAMRYGGVSDDAGISINVDVTGNVYTTGVFGSTVSFNPKVGGSYLTSKGYSDVFILKTGPSGNTLWAKSFGGFSPEYGRSILDKAGNVYTVGSFLSDTVDFDPGAGTTNLISSGLWEVFVQKLSSSGHFLWAKSFGGTNNDHGEFVTVDDLGNVYTTGCFRGIADFDPEAGISNLTSSGDYDVFIHKFIPCTSNNVSDVTTQLDGVTISANNVFANYQWLDCNNNYAVVPGETNQSFTPVVNGNYAVELNEGGCIDTSACVAISTVGNLETQFDRTIRIFPNPTSKIFTIDLGSEEVSIQVIIRDALGRSVYFSNHTNTATIHCSLEATAGMYFIEIVSGMNIARLKLMLE